MTSTMSFLPSCRSFAPSLAEAIKSLMSLPVTSGGVVVHAASRKSAALPINSVNGIQASASALEISRIASAVLRGSRQSVSGVPPTTGTNTVGSASSSSRPW